MPRVHLKQNQKKKKKKTSSLVTHSNFSSSLQRYTDSERESWKWIKNWLFDHCIAHFAPDLIMSPPSATPFSATTTTTWLLLLVASSVSHPHLPIAYSLVLFSFLFPIYFRSIPKPISHFSSIFIFFSLKSQTLRISQNLGLFF